MNYLSLNFFILFLFSFYLYWNVNNQYRRYILLISSSIFYSLFSINYLFHLYFIILINYVLIKNIPKYSNRILRIQILFNLLNLIFFKYFYFVLESLGVIFGLPYLSEKTELNKHLSNLLSISNFEIVLPATISYYTFQFISLGVDCKNKKLEPPSLFDLSSFILFFPIMIAGPVTRLVDFKNNFLKQNITEESMRNGLWLISMGLIKKVILSDSISSIIFPVFAEPDKYSGFSLLLNSYFFAMNLYLDFSGLTDLARGMGILFGYELPANFKAPFFMNGFADFWRRWHLSFSYWIRDYIYIPLGGSRVSEWRNYLNLIITFSLGGLWHGANFNYLFWGILTGFFISIERFFEIRNLQFNNTKIKKFIYYIFVLHMYIITWNLFFTKNLSDAWFVISRIVLFSKGFTMPYIETGIYVTILGILYHLSEEHPDKFYVKEKYKKYLLPIFGLIFVLVILNSSNRDFFYGKY